MLKFDLAHARSVRKLRQQLESWSPLAEGQIIAQGALRPIVCQGGYAADGVKEAIIWGNGTELTGSFELIDMTTNRQPPEPPSVVYSGKLRYVGRHIWGGNNYVAVLCCKHPVGFMRGL